MKTDTQMAYDTRGQRLRYVCTYCARDVIITQDGMPVSRQAPAIWKPLSNARGRHKPDPVPERYYDFLRERWDKGLCGCGCDKPINSRLAKWFDKSHGKNWRRRIETQERRMARDMAYEEE